MPQRNAAQKVLPVIATVLVVLGVVAIARFNASRQTGQVQTGSKISDARLLDGQAATTSVLTALLSGRSLKIFNAKTSAVRECAPPDGFTIVDDVTKDGFVVRSATGARMLVGLDCVVKNPKLVPGLANPSGGRAVKVAGKRQDGAGVIEISDGKFTEEITLRGKNSRPYRDPEIVGWLDENTVVIVAMQGDTRRVLSVQTTGRVTEFLKLPENAAEVQTGNGVFWYVTFTSGEGIEVGPRGPSELHRVSLEGRDEVVAREDGAVIENARIGPQGRAAYLAGGTLMLETAAGKFANIGTGQPLGWSDDGSLLVSRNRRLFSIAPDASNVALEIATDGAAAAWQFRQE